jgi:predicted SnoaL-like aldol condensation-catalyzing enzyme
VSKASTVNLRALLFVSWLLAGCAGPLAGVERDLRPLATGHVVEGRSWRGKGVRVVEFAFVGDRFGVIGAAVIDGHGRRIYLDRVTLRGQREPSRIPKDLAVRAPLPAPLEGRERLVSRGTSVETRNLQVANAVWAALDRHDAAQAMAPATDDYRYDDYSAPQALGRAETQKLVADFVAAIPDFLIAEKPVQFAAGDDVITEMVEHGTFRGHAVVLHGLDVKRFRDGKIVKEWQYANYAELLQQLFGIVVE